MVGAEQLADCTHLALIAGVHSQELVHFWREYDSSLDVVLVLLGSSSVHIAKDLKLPTTKYIAIASRDTLSKIEPEIRHRMIPHA